MNNPTIFQGLDVAWKGLAGVFLVLIVLFVLIKLMLAVFKSTKK